MAESCRMTATLIHRDDPLGIQLARLFRNTIYLDFPWTTAKRLGAFPRVEYLEALPTLQGTRVRQPTDNVGETVLMGP